MGGLLLWFPNTHSDTCTHIYTHTNHPSPGLLWPYPWVLSNQSTAGATCPSQKGKVAIFDISIKLPYQWGVVVMLVFLWWQRIRANLPLLDICFYILFCVSLFLALFVVNIAVTTGYGLRFLWLPPRTWTKQPGWRTRRNVLSWWEHFIKTHLFSALVRIIVFKPSANHTDSSSRSAGCSQ